MFQKKFHIVVNKKSDSFTVISYGTLKQNKIYRRQLERKSRSLLPPPTTLTDKRRASSPSPTQDYQAR